MPPPAATFARVGAYRWLIFIAVGVFVADQVSKAWIAATLEFESMHPYGGITVIPGFFHLVHVGNTGAAWGLFAGKSIWLAALALVTLAAIFAFRRHLELRRPVVQISFGLLCGGIAGNLLDRVRPPHHVVDFLLFYIGSHDWPAFNLADSAICVGVGLYLLHSFRAPRSEAVGSSGPPGS